MAIEFPTETTKAFVAAIREYYRRERGEDIGDLQASLLLDFILREILPTAYNQGVSDAQAALQRMVGDVDVALHQSEFGYTAGLARRERTRSDTNRQ